MEEVYLMCPPNFYNTHFLFNPWMNYKEQVDSEKAKEQWRTLEKTIKRAGGRVELVQPDWQESAMVFTRDNALVFDIKKALILRSYGPRGKREPKLLFKYFKSKKWEVFNLPKGIFLEGGNMIFLNNDIILAGWREGESTKGYEWLADFLEKKLKRKFKIILLKLINKKYLHLDMVLAPLKDKGFLIYPFGLNLGKNWRNSFLWQGKPIIELEEKEYFGANLIIVNNTLISSTLSQKTIKKIENLGFKVKNLNLSEFHKAGGGAHCLTLDLMPFK